MHLLIPLQFAFSSSQFKGHLASRLPTSVHILVPVDFTMWHNGAGCIRFSSISHPLSALSGASKIRFLCPPFSKVPVQLHEILNGNTKMKDSYLESGTRLMCARVYDPQKKEREQKHRSARSTQIWHGMVCLRPFECASLRRKQDLLANLRNPLQMSMESGGRIGEVEERAGLGLVLFV